MDESIINVDLYFLECMRRTESFLCRFLGNWCQGSFSWLEGTATTLLLAYGRTLVVRTVLLSYVFVALSTRRLPGSLLGIFQQLTCLTAFVTISFGRYTVSVLSSVLYHRRILVLLVHS
jgi:hypothetical protein